MMLMPVELTVTPREFDRLWTLATRLTENEPRYVFRSHSDPLIGEAREILRKIADEGRMGVENPEIILALVGTDNCPSFHLVVPEFQRKRDPHCWK